jgi:hypothetical protein
MERTQGGCSPCSKIGMGINNEEHLTQAVARGRKIGEAKKVQVYVGPIYTYSSKKVP